MESTPWKPATESRGTSSKEIRCWKRRRLSHPRQTLRRKIVVSLNRELPCACVDSCLSGHWRFWLQYSFLPEAAHVRERRTLHPMQHPRRYWISANCELASY